MTSRLTLNIIKLLLSVFYTLFVLFSINIQPFRLILGFICLLIIPGHSFLCIIKEESKNKMQKIGLSLIMSIAIISILMSIAYFIIFNYSNFEETTQKSFYFDESMILIILQLINIGLISIQGFQERKKNQISEIQEIKQNGLVIGKDFTVKSHDIILIILFVISLILIGMTSYNKTDIEDFETAYFNYKNPFTFFTNVFPLFYIFLALSIVLLVLIILYVKNVYLCLISISLFFYTIWILPYLQIGNYFNWDTYLFFRIYESYKIHGFKLMEGYGVYIEDIGPHRYTTSLFTSIFLCSGLSININFLLWYINPLFLITIPFFFYSKFYNNSNIENSERRRLISIILVLFVMLAPIFLKSARTASAGPLGIFIFILLALELLSILKTGPLKFKERFKDFGYIIFLFFFLCITHTEESTYFIILLTLSTISYTIYKIEKAISVKTNERGNKENLSPQILETKNNNNLKTIKREYLSLSVLSIIIFSIFYFTQDFFGWIQHIVGYTVGDQGFLNLISEAYKNSRIYLFGWNVKLSYLSFGFIILLSLVFFSSTYIFLFKFNRAIINKIGLFDILWNKKIPRIKKILNLKSFNISMVIILYSILIIAYFNYFATFNVVYLFDYLFWLITYTFIVIQILLFIQGIKYYKLTNAKQDFYLLSIISSTFLILFLLVIEVWFALFELHTRFLTILIVFNLLIIQNSILTENLSLWDKKALFLSLGLCVFIGVLYSLRSVAFG